MSFKQYKRMENQQNLLVKRAIARICVVMIICTTLFGTLLAFGGKNGSIKNKKQLQSKSILSNPQPLHSGGSMPTGFSSE